MAADIGQKLKGIDFDAVYTSDMLRAVQTAELILEAGEKGGVPIEKDARLRGMVPGVHGGGEQCGFRKECIGLAGRDNLFCRVE